MEPRDGERGEEEQDHRGGDEEHRQHIGGGGDQGGEDDDSDDADPPGLRDRSGREQSDEVEDDEEDREDEGDAGGDDDLEDEVEVVGRLEDGAEANEVSTSTIRGKTYRPVRQPTTKRGSAAPRKPNVYFFSFAVRPGVRNPKISPSHTGLERMIPEYTAMRSCRSKAPVTLS